MLKLLIACLMLWGSLCANAQSGPGTLDVISWNVEWFGSTSNGPANESLQEQNVVSLLRYLNADIYGLVEIVDTARLRRVTDSLGDNWAWVISPFGSGNNTGTGTSWLTAQKLAFVYNMDYFSNVQVRGLLRNSTSAYTNWASGRFPFMLSAQVTVGTGSREVNFILIHGKAGSTPTDYDRRKNGMQELKDTLDQYFSTTTNIILGDYNDALNTTICVGCGTGITSYSALVVDSLDSDHYKSITLPLGALGQSSMTNFPNVVDNHVISNELAVLYVPGSARIRTDVATRVNDYGNTTSDHYPVFSQYNLALTGLPAVSPPAFGVQLESSVIAATLRLRAARTLRNITLTVHDASGRVVTRRAIGRWDRGTLIEIPTQHFSSGLYVLTLSGDKARTSLKLVR